LQQTNFALDAQLNFEQLKLLSKLPAIITVAGVIKQNKGDWQINLAENSHITLSSLSLSSASTTDDITELGADKLITKVDGTIDIVNNASVAKNVGTDQNKVESAEKIILDLKLNNEITRLKIANVMQLEQVQLTSAISGSMENISVNAQVLANSVEVATINLTGNLAQPKLDVLANDVLITDLLALNINLPVDVKLIDGKLSYHLSGQLLDLSEPMNNEMELSLSIQELTGEITDIWLQDLNLQQSFMLSKGDITSVQSNKSKVNNLSIGMIEAAVPIENFASQILINTKQQNIALVANNIQGETLGGSFKIANAEWPFQAERSVDVQLNGIDLEKLLELDQQQGIVVTGKISGILPVYYDGQQWLLEEGELYNVSEGIIQVKNNPAVAELKANNPELKLAFDALQNLHYHQLTSAVSMADDGYMLLATEIKGINPDIDNEVNLNLNLNYDLLGLLESLDITKQMENRIIKQSPQKIQQH